MPILAFDTETTGLPDFKARSNDPVQPHLVQLALVTCDEDGNEIMHQSVIVRPDGWIIPKEMTAISSMKNCRARMMLWWMPAPAPDCIFVYNRGGVMPKFHWDVAQGSVEWMRLRAGRPTASEFDSVMTPKTMKPSESRKKYGARLIAQRVMNWQADSLETIKHIADGKENEPLAVAKMELVYDIASQPVGFVTTDDGRFGASPDRVAHVSASRERVGIVTEVKSPTVPVQMERLIFGDNDAYRCQRQGQLFVAQADKAIFFSYNPRMPDYMVEDGRDEKFITALADCLERFSDELHEWERKVRAAGVFQAYAELVTPAEAEYGDNGLMSDAELDGLIHRETLKWGG